MDSWVSVVCTVLLDPRDPLLQSERMQGFAEDPDYWKGEVFAYVGLPQNLKDLKVQAAKKSNLRWTWERRGQWPSGSGHNAHSYFGPRRSTTPGRHHSVYYFPGTHRSLRWTVVHLNDVLYSL